jgi:hypothetical protein
LLTFSLSKYLGRFRLAYRAPGKALKRIRY